MKKYVVICFVTSLPDFPALSDVLHIVMKMWELSISAHRLWQTFHTYTEAAVFTEMLINVQRSSIKINLIM